MKNVFWTPEREWDGQEAFLIGGGSSLRSFNFNLLRGRNVIGCNDAFHLGEDIVKICCFADAQWWHRNKWELSKGFANNRLVTNSPQLVSYQIPNLLKMKLQKQGVHSGCELGLNFSTGAMAINLAYSLGAKIIFLLGYDLCNVNNVSHWHKHNKKVAHNEVYERFIRGFENVRIGLEGKGVDVWNVTDGTSKLLVFQRMHIATLADALANTPKAEVATC